MLTCLALLETQSLPQDSLWLEIEQLVNAPCGTMQPRLWLFATVQKKLSDKILLTPFSQQMTTGIRQYLK